MYHPQVAKALCTAHTTAISLLIEKLIVRASSLGGSGEGFEGHAVTKALKLSALSGGCVRGWS